MAFLCYIPAVLISRMLHSACKRNVALQSEYAVSNTSCRSCEHFLSRILHFSGTFEHFLRKGSTPCLGFCVFRALSNTSSGRGASLVSDSAFFGHFRTRFPRKRTRLVSDSALFLHFQTVSQSRQNIHPAESILPPGRIFFSCGSAALPAQGMRAGLRKQIPLTNVMRPLSLEQMCFLIRRCSLMRRRDLTPWHF